MTRTPSTPHPGATVAVRLGAHCDAIPVVPWAVEMTGHPFRGRLPGRVGHDPVTARSGCTSREWYMTRSDTSSGVLLGACTRIRSPRSPRGSGSGTS